MKKIDNIYNEKNKNKTSINTKINECKKYQKI